MRRTHLNVSDAADGMSQSARLTRWNRRVSQTEAMELTRLTRWNRRVCSSFDERLFHQTHRSLFEVPTDESLPRSMQLVRWNSFHRTRNRVPSNEDSFDGTRSTRSMERGTDERVPSNEFHRTRISTDESVARSMERWNRRVGLVCSTDDGTDDGTMEQSLSRLSHRRSMQQSMEQNASDDRMRQTIECVRR